MRRKSKSAKKVAKTILKNKKNSKLLKLKRRLKANPRRRRYTA